MSPMMRPLPDMVLSRCGFKRAGRNNFADWVAEARDQNRLVGLRDALQHRQACSLELGDGHLFQRQTPG